MSAVDIMSGLECLAHDWESGTATTREFCRLFPSELAKVRRQVYRQAGWLPVPVKGSSARGLKAGYFATRLRDGSLGYLQRRTDDCLQAAIASCLQVPAPLVPDLHMEDQLAAGKDPEEMERGIREKMKRWTEQRGVRILYHSSPLTSERRWIGVITEPGAYSDHCLLMSGPDCLFDPACLMPSRQLVTEYDTADIDYAITIERR